MSTVYSPVRGSEIKYQFSLTAEDYTTADMDFTITVIGNLGTQTITKDECIAVDDDYYIMIVDSSLTGSGTLQARITAYVPDADCDDSYRTEVVTVVLDKVY